MKSLRTRLHNHYTAYEIMGLYNPQWLYTAYEIMGLNNPQWLYTAYEIMGLNNPQWLYTAYEIMGLNKIPCHDFTHTNIVAGSIVNQTTLYNLKLLCMYIQMSQNYQCMK